MCMCIYVCVCVCVCVYVYNMYIFNSYGTLLAKLSEFSS